MEKKTGNWKKEEKHTKNVVFYLESRSRIMQWRHSIIEESERDKDKERRHKSQACVMHVGKSKSKSEGRRGR